MVDKLGQILNRKILLSNIPKFILQLLFGEMSTILLNGSKVSSKKIMEHGFKFKYGKLDLALNNLLNK